MQTTRWVLAAAILVPVSGASVADRPTAEELLGAYQKSVEPFTRAQIEWTERRPKRQIGEDRILEVAHERAIVRNDSRWRVSDVTRQSQTSNGVKREFVARQDFIVGEQVVSVQLIDTRDGKQVPVEQGLQIIAWLDPRNGRGAEGGALGRGLDPEQTLWSVVGGARILFGKFSGDAGQPIWKVMRDSSTLEVLPETEVIGGFETLVLKSRGKFGSHTLWLDMKAGGLPRRIEVVKKLGDLYDDDQFGARIGQAEEPPRLPGKRPPPDQKPDLRESSLRIEDIRIENKDGVFFIAAWNADERITRGDGKSNGGHVEYSVSTVNVKPETWPENAFRPSIEIPNKTRVFARDGLPGTEYEWLDGKIQVRGSN